MQWLWHLVFSTAGRSQCTSRDHSAGVARATQHARRLAGRLVRRACRAARSSSKHCGGLGSANAHGTVRGILRIAAAETIGKACINELSGILSIAPYSRPLGASPLPSPAKASSYWVFCRLPGSGFAHGLPFPSVWTKEEAFQRGRGRVPDISARRGVEITLRDVDRFLRSRRAGRRLPGPRRSRIPACRW